MFSYKKNNLINEHDFLSCVFKAGVNARYKLAQDGLCETKKVQHSTISNITTLPKHI